MDKLKMQTADMVERNIEMLGQMSSFLFLLHKKEGLYP